MIEQPFENVNPAGRIPDPIRFDFGWLDEQMERGKRKKKKKKQKKATKIDKKYAQLAFQYGVLASRYDTLTRMVELAVSAKRQWLDDSLLDEGLVALKPAHNAFTPVR